MKNDQYVNDQWGMQNRCKWLILNILNFHFASIASFALHFSFCIICFVVFKEHCHTPRSPLKMGDQKGTIHNAI